MKIPYPFPLSTGEVVFLELPDPLDRATAKRICAMVLSLVGDDGTVDALPMPTRPNPGIPEKRGVLPPDPPERPR